jgi:hypothetical protein
VMHDTLFLRHPVPSLKSYPAHSLRSDPTGDVARYLSGGYLSRIAQKEIAP